MLTECDGPYSFLGSLPKNCIITGNFPCLTFLSACVNRQFCSKDLAKASRNDSAEEERSQRIRLERRKILMEKLERAMIDAEVVEDTRGAEDTEVFHFFTRQSGSVV